MHKVTILNCFKRHMSYGVIHIMFSRLRRCIYSTLKEPLVTIHNPPTANLGYETKGGPNVPRIREFC